MRIEIQEATPTLELADQINYIIDVSDAIYPPGISSAILDEEGDMVVMGASAPQKFARATADGLSPISDSTVSGRVKWGIPGSTGLGLWNAVPGAPVLSNNRQFTVTDTGNVNGYDGLLRGTALKWTDSGSTKRAVVTGASYASDTVTVTIAGDALSGTATMETLQYTRFHREVQLALCDPDTDLETGDSKANLPVPLSMDGWYVVWVYARADTAPTGAAIIIQIANNNNDMLSTRLTIDANETHSKTAATPPVVNATYRRLAYGQDIDIDVDQVGSIRSGTGVSVAVVACPL